jgi:hypothetical protein
MLASYLSNGAPTVGLLRVVQVGDTKLNLTAEFCKANGRKNTTDSSNVSLPAIESL